MNLAEDNLAEIQRNKQTNSLKTNGKSVTTPSQHYRFLRAGLFVIIFFALVAGPAFAADTWKISSAASDGWNTQNFNDSSWTDFNQPADYTNSIAYLRKTFDLRFFSEHDLMVDVNPHTRYWEWWPAWPWGYGKSWERRGADNLVTCWVNGNKMFDSVETTTIDISSYLKNGKNVVACEVRQGISAYRNPWCYWQNGYECFQNGIKIFNATIKNYAVPKGANDTIAWSIDKTIWHRSTLPVNDETNDGGEYAWKKSCDVWVGCYAKYPTNFRKSFWSGWFGLPPLRYMVPAIEPFKMPLIEKWVRLSSAVKPSCTLNGTPIEVEPNSDQYWNWKYQISSDGLQTLLCYVYPDRYEYSMRDIKYQPNRFDFSFGGFQSPELKILPTAGIAGREMNVDVELLGRSTMDLTVELLDGEKIIASINDSFEVTENATRSYNLSVPNIVPGTYTIRAKVFDNVSRLDWTAEASAYIAEKAKQTEDTVDFTIPNRSVWLGQWYRPVEQWNVWSGSGYGGEWRREAGHLEGTWYYTLPTALFWRTLVWPNGTETILDEYKFDGRQPDGSTPSPSYYYYNNGGSSGGWQSSPMLYWSEPSVPKRNITLPALEEDAYIVKLHMATLSSPTADRFPYANRTSTIDLWTGTPYKKYQYNYFGYNGGYSTGEYWECTPTDQSQYVSEGTYSSFTTGYNKGTSCGTTSCSSWDDGNKSCANAGMKNLEGLECKFTYQEFTKSWTSGGYTSQSINQYDGCWIEHKTNSSVKVEDIANTYEAYEFDVDLPMSISSVNACADAYCDQLLSTNSLFASEPVYIYIETKWAEFPLRVMVLEDNILVADQVFYEDELPVLEYEANGASRITVIAADAVGDSDYIDIVPGEVPIPPVVPSELALPFVQASGGDGDQTTGNSGAAAIVIGAIGAAGVGYYITRKPPKRVSGSAWWPTKARSGGKPTGTSTTFLSSFGRTMEAAKAAGHEFIEDTKRKYAEWLAWVARANSAKSSAKNANTVGDIDALLESGLLDSITYSELSNRRSGLISEQQQSAAAQKAAQEQAAFAQRAQEIYDNIQSGKLSPSEAATVLSFLAIDAPSTELANALRGDAKSMKDFVTQQQMADTVNTTYSLPSVQTEHDISNEAWWSKVGRGFQESGAGLWNGITSFFGGVADGVRNAYDNFRKDPIGSLSYVGNALATGAKVIGGAALWGMTHPLEANMLIGKAVIGGITAYANALKEDPIGTLAKTAIVIGGIVAAIPSGGTSLLIAGAAVGAIGGGTLLVQNAWEYGNARTEEELDAYAEENEEDLGWVAGAGLDVGLGAFNVARASGVIWRVSGKAGQVVDVASPEFKAISLEFGGRYVKTDFETMQHIQKMLFKVDKEQELLGLKRTLEIKLLPDIKGAAGFYDPIPDNIKLSLSYLKGAPNKAREVIEHEPAHRITFSNLVKIGDYTPDINTLAGRQKTLEHFREMFNERFSGLVNKGINPGPLFNQWVDVAAQKVIATGGRAKMSEWWTGWIARHESLVDLKGLKEISKLGKLPEAYTDYVRSKLPFLAEMKTVSENVGLKGASEISRTIDRIMDMATPGVKEEFQHILSNYREMWNIVRLVK